MLQNRLVKLITSNIWRSLYKKKKKIVISLLHLYEDAEKNVHVMFVAMDFLIIHI